MDKVSFFRAKTLFTRRTYYIQLDRHIARGGMTWLREQLGEDKYLSCPDIQTFCC
jgi:hypothetical protein